MNTPWLEIIIPVRDPGAALLATGATLAAQTERGFGVCLSDNHSAIGQDIIRQFQTEMERAQIPVRILKPPFELGRVPHWNWAHAQAEAEWIKPLFAGGLLNPAYVAHLKARVTARPGAQLVRCDHNVCTAAGNSRNAAPFQEESLTPVEFLKHFPQSCDWIGSSLNLAYRRLAWQAAGGYPVHLPACAGLKLNVSLALRHGLEVIHEPLATFVWPEGARHSRPRVELWLVLRQAQNYCLSVNLPWPQGGVWRGTLRGLNASFLPLEP